MSRPLITLALSLAPLLAAAAPADKAYRTQGDCDGFPAVALTTPEGLCVGLVAEGLGHGHQPRRLPVAVRLRHPRREPELGLALRLRERGRGHGPFAGPQMSFAFESIFRYADNESQNRKWKL